MTALTFANDAFFASALTPQESVEIADLGWKRHPQRPDSWFTRSPYLAAPLWRCGDVAATAALHPYAWHYETSFARGPLEGTGADAIRLPVGRTPYPFQIAGVQRALMRERLIIADEPGCGKTPQSLAVINHLRPNRVVIGCPTFLAENWAAECENWLCDAQPIAILDGAKRTAPERGIVILPYSRAHSFAAQILAGPPIDYLIMDEFHRTKTPTARRTVPFLGEGGLARRARRVAALSGTPMPNNPLELYGVLSALAPELTQGVTRERFQQTYCQTIDMKVKTPRGGQIDVQKVVARGQKALNAELRASGLMIRRLKNDVLEQLPPKNVYFVHLRPDAGVADLVREEADLYDQLQMRIMTAQELIALKGHVGHVRAQLGLLKAPAIAAYCQWVFDQGESRLVLFMLHLPAIEAVRRAFEGHGVKVHVLTGGVDPAERFKRVKDFQAPGGRKLAIGQIEAAGEGLTMTAARYCVMGEIAWTPGKNEQCIDRVHRISQTRQVDAPILTYPHSADERVIRTNARKALDAKEVLDINLQNLFREAAE